MKTLVCSLTLFCLCSNLQAMSTFLLTQPCRMVDTRTDLDGAAPVPANQSYGLNIRGVCGVPETAEALILLVHAWPTVANGGYVKVYSGDVITLNPWATLTYDTAGIGRSIQMDVPMPPINTTIHEVLFKSPWESHYIVDVVGWLQNVSTTAEVSTIATVTQDCSSSPCKTYYHMVGEKLPVVCMEPYFNPTSCLNEHETNDCVSVAGWVLSDGAVNYLVATAVYNCPS